MLGYLYLIAVVLGMAAVYSGIGAVVVAALARRTQARLGYFKTARLAFLGLYPGFVIINASYAVTTAILGRPLSETSPLLILGGLALQVWTVRQSFRHVLATPTIVD